jgi:hypothetical protein
MSTVYTMHHNVYRYGRNQTFGYICDNNTDEKDDRIQPMIAENKSDDEE